MAKIAKILPILISGPQRSFTDDFTRADGAPGNGWVTTGGAISGNALVITPTLGSEALVNGGFTNWTADDPDGWTIYGTEPGDGEICEVATGEAHADCGTPGGGHANIYRAGAGGFTIGQSVIAANTWYRTELDIDTATSGSVDFRVSGVFVGPVYSTTGLKVATWGRYGSSGIIGVFAHQAGCDITMDSASAKPITMSTAFAYRQQAFANAYAQVKVTRAADTQAGVIQYSDASNYVMAFLEGDNRLQLMKCVGGVMTLVASSGVTYSAGSLVKLTRNGTSYTASYKGFDYISGATISDAVFASATNWGVWSSYAGNSFDDYTWEAL